MKSPAQFLGAIPGDGLWLIDVGIGLYPPGGERWSFMLGERWPFVLWLGCGVAELAVGGRGVETVAFGLNEGDPALLLEFDLLD